MKESEDFFQEKFSKNKIEVSNKMFNYEIKNILSFLNNSKKEDMLSGIINDKSKMLGFEFIAFGSSSIVFKYKHYAIKVFNKYTVNHRFYSNKDGDILKMLQGIDIYTKLYIANSNFIVTEFIEGILLRDFSIGNINTNYKEILLKGIKETLKRGYFPFDLHSKNIIINSKGDFIIIDVGCFYITEAKDVEEMSFDIFEDFEYNYCDTVDEYLYNSQIQINLPA